MNIRLLILAALLWPIHAISDNFTYSSDIPEVALWRLVSDANNFPYQSLPDGDDEFAKYCNGTRFIYVAALYSSFRGQLQCQLQVDTGGFYRIYLKTKARFPDGLVLISKRPIPNRVRSLPITMEESEEFKKAEEWQTVVLANEAKSYVLKTYPDTSVADYSRYIEEIKKKAIYRKYAGARFKLPSPRGYIYISAIGLSLGPIGMGWEINNVIFREIDGKLQNIGTFEGCIQGFRDLNTDGTPEVLTITCENDEGFDWHYRTIPGN